MPGLDVAFKPAPVACPVIYCFAQSILRGDLRLVFLQLGLELGEQRQAVLLTALMALLGFLEVVLDAVLMSYRLRLLADQCPIIPIS